MLLRHSLLVAALACTVGATLPAADQGSGSASGTAAQSTLSQDDQRFLRKAALNGLFEVESAKLAQSKQLPASHQQLATMILTDHTAANQELMAYAETKGIELPTSLDEKHREKLDELAKLDGEAFAKRFQKLQVEAHQDAIKDFRGAAKDSQDADLRAWAMKTLPVLEQHRMHLEGATTTQGASHGMDSERSSSSRSF